VSGESHLTRDQIRLGAGAFYLLLGGAGLGWVRLRTGSWWPESLPGEGWRDGLLVGIPVAAAVVVATRVLMSLMPGLESLAREFRRLLGPIDARTALFLGLVSGVGEEIFFRGAMQPALGFIATSLLFGFIHVGPGRRYLVWTGFAVVMGFAFGGMLMATGSLLGPMVAHVGINSVNLWRIGRLDPADGTPDAEEPVEQGDSPGG
jgi:membrane protease YdiL (CAAX protease family)